MKLASFRQPGRNKGALARRDSHPTRHGQQKRACPNERCRYREVARHVRRRALEDANPRSAGASRVLRAAEQQGRRARADEQPPSPEPPVASDERPDEHDEGDHQCRTSEGEDQPRRRGGQ